MIFLIEYDRRSGQVVNLRSYADSAKHEAEEARLALEISQKRASVEREVVLLEAVDEAALRKTHRRYFENWKALASN